MTSKSHDPDAEADDRLLHRMLFFSDAVFAIVLTLLALELKAPQGRNTAELAKGLANLAGDLGAFTGSFALVGIWWLAHANALRRMARFDWLLAGLNLVFLLTVCLIPFGTSLIAHSGVSGLAWEIYCWNQVLTSSVMVLMSIAVTRRSGYLIGGSMSGHERLYRVLRGALPGLAFVVSLLILRFGNPKWAASSTALIPLEFLALRQFARPKIQTP
ncbi:MAG: hypothetical protein CGW95_02595 [Phenylobacterium zucineum]|nr:MAG: hypothetical protein CGW95_02595 [Phenylobacterium zucineum]